MGDIKESIKAVLTGKGFNGGDPLSSFKLVYDSDANQLEPIYYWVLDFMTDNIGIKEIEKITDNFQSSPGSGHFADMGQRATAMQQQATKILADTNTLIKMIVNLVYDLKEYEMRLAQYKKANSKDKKEKEEGMLSLKNVWLDQVDMKRGRGSIHQMSYEMGYTTLREAFLIANTVDDAKNMAGEKGVINDSVMRILIPRLSEFLLWKEMSEKELTKRFEIEKSYLKSEVESLKMYAKWARPYLKAAEALRMKGFDNNAALVNAFSTTMFELTIMAKTEMSIEKNADLKKKFGNKKLDRKYYSVQIISFKYRGELAQKVTQKGDYAFGFGGKVEMIFDSYALNSEELTMVKKKMEDADLLDGMNMVEDNMRVAFGQLKDDIEKYCTKTEADLRLEELKKKKDGKKEMDTNPFSALWSLFTFDFGSSPSKPKDIKDVKDIKKDSFVEESVRTAAADKANGTLYAIYDVYKKAHAMASSPENFDNGKKS
jgi:hypothetical protein